MSSSPLLRAPTSARVPITSICVPEGRRTLRKIEELTASIAEVGLLNAVTVTAEHRLIAGYHRLEACKRLGWEEIDARIVTLGELDAELAEIDENLVRNDLTMLERAEHYCRRKQLYEVKHPQTRRGVAGGKARQDSATEIISFADETAAKTGVTPRTVRQEVQIASQLNEHVRDLIRETPLADSKVDLLTLARRSPLEQRTLVNKVLEGRAPNAQAALRQLKEDQREQRREQNRQLVKAAPTIEAALGAARFSTIVADPPWSAGEKGEEDGEGLYGRGRPVYATMSLTEIKNLTIGTFADEDAHLYLWATNISLPRAFDVLEIWGFRYVTTMTWCKPHFGMGAYFRGSTEHVLFGIKGSQPLKRHDVGTWFEAPRGPDGHSSKPVEFFELVESCSPGPYLEVFARGQRDGWVCWGAEA